MHPLLNAFSALTNPRIADSHVFLKRTLFSHRRNSYSVSIFLEQKSISGAHPSLRRISRGTVTCPLLVTLACFFMPRTSLPYFITCVLTFPALPSSGRNSP